MNDYYQVTTNNRRNDMTKQCRNVLWSLAWLAMVTVFCNVAQAAAPSWRVEKFHGCCAWSDGCITARTKASRVEQSM